MNRISRMRSLYPNFGKPWYRHDHLVLEHGMEKNFSLKVMCEKLGRNPAALVRQLVLKGLARRGSRGEVLRYCHQAMDWRMWAVVRDDVIVTDNFRRNSGEWLQDEDMLRLRSRFELSVASHAPRVSLKRDPYSENAYMFAEAQNMWLITQSIFAGLKDVG